jgi:hypothetical protein
MKVALEKQCPNPNDTFDWTGFEHWKILKEELKQVYFQFVLVYVKSSTEKSISADY